MSILEKLANAQGRRDEEPNKELGREMVDNSDKVGISEVARGLWHDEKAIRTDCIGVLEEIGRIEPTLIADYVEDFLKLLSSKHNRLVWQAMINLALIAELRPVEIFDAMDQIKAAIKKGSVITMDNGIKVLARVAATNREYNAEILPYLLDQLQTCRPKSVPQYAESILTAITAKSEKDFHKILKQRFPELSTPQQKRVKRILGD